MDEIQFVARLHVYISAITSVWALEYIPDDEMSPVHKKLDGRVLLVGKQVCVWIHVCNYWLLILTVGAGDVIRTVRVTLHPFLFFLHAPSPPYKKLASMVATKHNQS